MSERTVCPECHHRPSMRLNMEDTAGADNYTAECYCKCHDAADAAPDLLAALLAVEWAGGRVYGSYGPVMPCCPACKGIRPDYTPIGPPEYAERAGHRHGHWPGCVLDAAVAKATSKP